MKVNCSNCGYEFDGEISKDFLGWHSLCPECGCSFDVDAPDDMANTLYIEGRRSGYSADSCGRTMTVGELIDYLSYYERNAKVYIKNDNGYTYGNIDEHSFEEDFIV